MIRNRYTLYDVDVYRNSDPVALERGKEGLQVLGSGSARITAEHGGCRRFLSDSGDFRPDFGVSPSFKVA